MNLQLKHNTNQIMLKIKMEMIMQLIRIKVARKIFYHLIEFQGTKLIQCILNKPKFIVIMDLHPDLMPLKSKIMKYFFKKFKKKMEIKFKKMNKKSRINYNLIA